MYIFVHNIYIYMYIFHLHVPFWARHEACKTPERASLKAARNAPTTQAMSACFPNRIGVIGEIAPFDAVMLRTTSGGERVPCPLICKFSLSRKNRRVAKSTGFGCEDDL